MLTDAHGLALTTDSADVVAAFDDTVAGYLKYRADAGKRLGRVLEIDSDFAMGQVQSGYYAMLAFNKAYLPVARQALTFAQQTLPKATAREQAHGAALKAWIDGDLFKMIAIWDEILAEHPTDIMAFRLAHFNNFWLGRAGEMVASVEQVLPKWGRDLPGYGSLLACKCFANEECGNYDIAEPAGRQAIDIDPADLWAAHAVAHVLEMQGRRDEGIDWLKGLEPHWDGANNLAHHLWWHRGLYHLERGEFHDVLDLYDQRFRNLNSQLTQAQPDLYIDMQNAVSMLFRLVRQNVDVGARWEELADKAEARIGDCRSAFTLPHFMMALAAAGRFDAGERMLDAMRTFGDEGNGATQPLIRDYALPICSAALLRAKGEHDAAVNLMRPLLDGMYQLGGSHAQQDVLEQLFLDSALQAEREGDIKHLLQRVRDRHPVAPEHRIGYAAAAERYN